MNDRTIFNASLAQDVEIRRAAKHLQDKGFLETMSLLIAWMGTDQAKRMNDFWDKRRGI